MIRVYVAGRYSGSNVLEVLRNIGQGEAACTDLFGEGLAPFCPWHNKSFVIGNPEAPYEVEDFYAYSMAWLDVSDALFVLPGFEVSHGTLAEISRAHTLNIPVFYNKKDLMEWARNLPKEKRGAVR